MHCSDLRGDLLLRTWAPISSQEIALTSPINEEMPLRGKPISTPIWDSSNDHISGKAEVSFVNTSQFNFFLYPVPFHAIP